MITAILIILAAIFKAIADTLAHHFYSSVFRRWENSPFWNPLHKRNDAVKRIFNYPIDAWHLANSGMIVCFIVAVAVGEPIVINAIGLKIWGGFAVLAYGLLFNLVFNLFYNKIFR